MKTKILSVWFAVLLVTPMWGQDDASVKKMSIYQTCSKNGITMNETGGMHNNHEFVDLGLPSGTMWATMNLGAEQPEDYGLYYFWARKTSTQYYGWNNSGIWCRRDGSYYYISKYTKYNATEYPFNVESQDTLSIITKDDDAASQSWGGAWRIPTKAEWEELLANCTSTQVTQNNIKGIKLTSKKYPERSVFFPKAGYGPMPNNSSSGSSPTSVGTTAAYWSASLYEKVMNAYYVTGSSSFSMNNIARAAMCSIRPVVKL